MSASQFVNRSAQEHLLYIQEKVNPILEALVTAVLLERPDDPSLFMLKWLREQTKTLDGGDQQRSNSSAEEIEAVRTEVNKLKERKAQLLLMRSQGRSTAAEIMSQTSTGPPDEKESDVDEDEDDEVDLPLEPPKGFNRGQRQSVSAEAYGEWNKKIAFVPPVYEKTPEQKSRIQDVLQKSFLFQSLETADLDTVILAMKERNEESGVRIIQAGDDGECLYVVESGTCDCTKMIDGAEKVVKTCTAGDVFGELALLYNCPRAASCDVKDSASICWQLDRETFNHIVKEAATKRRSKYDEFLKTVSLLSSLDQYERSQIADGLKPEIYKKGDVIVKQDEPGNMFYIIEEGNLYASKTFPGEGARRVMDYKPGDYFGELALLKNQPRAASVIVESAEAKVLALSRNSFTKMLGPLQDILGKKAEQKYR
eukprot:gnl/TRDRNA2_/TRDRNA2_168865_c1_seq2.p1 gnl/TRDRNA2_/TRDRNA2_168865_c1~~gnl/TRDRNA2_/TRDRNA2_168865_c1_seq2.p1  ORF type:complete len:426 (+),score=121.02 gnl/TRDRNA2_/TRDRNA2_168865_c1_seq2:73-1350(+)